MPILNVDVEGIAGSTALLVRCRGEIDAHTFEDLEETLNTMIDDGAIQIIVDLSGVPYMSSAGMGILIASKGEVEDQGGDLVLLNPVPDVAGTLTDAGLADVFVIAKTREEALARFGA